MYKVVQQDPENCTCFGCMKIKSNKIFADKIKDLSTSIGFVPNKYNFFSPDKQESSQFDFEVAIKELSSVIKTNEDFLRNNSDVSIKFCRDCGIAHKLIRKNYIKVKGKKEYICPKCVALNYSRCYDCSELHLGQSTHPVYSSFEKKTVRVCENCFIAYRKCKFCGKFSKDISDVLLLNFDSHEEELVKSTTSCCSICSSRIKTCVECGCTNPNVESYKGRNLCKNCIDVQRPVCDYGFKPTPVFKLGENEPRKRKDTLFFGIEWEFENETERSHDYYTNKFSKFFKDRIFYIKKDSTIKHGVELVTHPFTWERFKEDKPAWTNVFNIAKEHLRSGSSDPQWGRTCGIHIHTNKSAYTTAQLYKKIKFTYDKRNRAFIMGISQREKENEYFKFRKQDEDHVPLIAKAKYLQSGERHSAINLQPSKTIEDRIFSSTIDVSHFFKNIEFIHAVYYFSRDCSMKRLGWRDFIDYISTKPKTYANLHAFIRQNMATEFAEYLTSKVGK